VRRILIEDQDPQKSDQDQKKSVKRRRKMKNVALRCFNYSGKGKGEGKVGKGKGGKGIGQDEALERPRTRKHQTDITGNERSAWYLLALPIQLPMQKSWLCVMLRKQLATTALKTVRCTSL
jgi:hypothetical protein